MREGDHGPLSWRGRHFFFPPVRLQNTITRAVESDNNSGDGAGTTRRNWFFAVACTIAIVALSVWPKPPEPPEVFRFPHEDKVVHFLMYVTYAVVLAWTFRAGNGTWRLGAALAIYGTLFGVFMEVLQGAFPVLGRSLSGMDMLANAIGSAAGVALYRLACRRRGLSYERDDDHGK
jgi:VanZ family protein